MKITKIALAVASAVAFTAANAATVNMTGASATSLNYVLGLKTLCSGTYTVYKTDTTTSALGNFFTAKCSQAFDGLDAGTTGLSDDIDAVAFNVSGGSFTAVSGSDGTATFAFVPAAGGTAVAGTGNLAGVDLQTGVATSAATTGVVGSAANKSSGGFLDIEPSSFPSSLLSSVGVDIDSVGAKTVAAGFNQAFGVAVSNDLYRALQRAQGITEAAGTTDDRGLSFQPTITRAQYTALAESTGNWAKGNIGQHLGLLAADYTATTPLALCRRAATSGTQSASNQYFLNSFVGGDGGVAGSYSQLDANNQDVTVNAGAGTSDARNCLNANGYGIGVLSAENIPAATVATGERGGYRFVKLNGVGIYDGAGSKANAQNGSYEFWFQSVMYQANDFGTAVTNAINGQLSTISSNGLWGITFANGEFSRNGNNAQNITRN